MCSKLKVSNPFMTSTHTAVSELAKTPTKMMTKFEVQNRKLTDRVVVPRDVLQSQYGYLKQLEHTDKVNVTIVEEVAHGLFHKPSNNKRSHIEALFIEWVQTNRSPSGRTLDSHGLYHGAEYHLSSIFRAIEKQRGDRRQKYEDFEIMSEVFCAGLPPELKALTGRNKPPSPGWVGTNWFPRLFSKPGSIYGHTTLCPMETDKCSYCCRLKIDEHSLRKSIGRHKQQGDQGNIERQMALKSAEGELLGILSDTADHRKECADAEDDYKGATKGKHAAYIELCGNLKQLLQLWWSDASKEQCELLESRLIVEASEYEDPLASDYQEEKLMPSWKASPQPGPTFFFSKRNCHVHILDAPGRGENSSASAIHKRVIYNRMETDGGHKDSNDTVSTVFDYLFSPTRPTCQQPALYRTGYGPDGPLAQTTAHTAAPNPNAVA